MILVNTIDRLEKELKQVAEACGTIDQNLSAKEKQAYAKGILDALELVRLYKTQSRDPQLADSGSDSEAAEQPVSKKLHQMTGEAVYRLLVSEDGEKIAETYSREDLAEAAFQFENELIGFLGDMNTIPFDSYTGLTDDQLVTIIKTSVAELCRLKNDN